jgi:hypothetical protein
MSRGFLCSFNEDTYFIKLQGSGFQVSRVLPYDNGATEDHRISRDYIEGFGEALLEVVIEPTVSSVLESCKAIRRMKNNDYRL